MTANLPEDVRGWTNEHMCLIRTDCKAFGAGAEEKIGVYWHCFANTNYT